jgi:hypothetical protein
MRTQPIEIPHLEDSDLLHLVDGDESDEMRERWLTHIQSCQECARRLEVLRRRASLVSELLSEIDLPPGFAYPKLSVPSPARARSRPGAVIPDFSGAWVRAAAVVLLFLTSLIAVPPLRAWVVDSVTHGWTELAALFGGGPSAEEPASSAAEGGSTLWFTPAGEEFRLEIVAPQAEGKLILTTVDGPQGALDITGRGSGATPLVFEGGLRILNTQRSTASYRVALPPGLARVRVRIGKGAPIVLGVEEIGPGRIVDLRRQSTDSSPSAAEAAASAGRI